MADDNNAIVNDTVNDEVVPTPDAEQEQVDAPEAEEAKPDREAAKYRRQLREVEAERDQLREQVTAWQRGAAEDAVRNKLVSPSLLWTDSMRTPADLVGEDGTIDPDKVSAAVADVVKQFGHEVKARGNYVPNEGFTGSRRNDAGGFASAFVPRRD